MSLAALHGGERVFEVAVAGVALVIQPCAFAAPVDILIGFPGILASAGEAEGLEAAGFERDVAGEDHQVGPGNLAAVFLFDRPEQAAGLVETHVVRPRVERGEALLAAATTAAAVAGAVGAGAMPCHADEEAGVGAEVGGPPVLRVGHERGEVFFERVIIEGFELRGVVEVRLHGVGFRRVLGKEFEFEPVGPPVAVGGAGERCSVVERTFGFGGHGVSWLGGLSVGKPPGTVWKTRVPAGLASAGLFLPKVGTAARLCKGFGGGFFGGIPPTIPMSCLAVCTGDGRGAFYPHVEFKERFSHGLPQCVRG